MMWLGRIATALVMLVATVRPQGIIQDKDSLPEIDLLDMIGLKDAKPLNGDKLVKDLGRAFLGAIFPEIEPKNTPSSAAAPPQAAVFPVQPPRGPPPSAIGLAGAPVHPQLSAPHLQHQLYDAGLTGRTDLPASYVYPFANAGTVVTPDNGSRQRFFLGPEARHTRATREALLHNGAL